MKAALIKEKPELKKKKQIQKMQVIWGRSIPEKAIIMVMGILVGVCLIMLVALQKQLSPEYLRNTTSAENVNK